MVPVPTTKKHHVGGWVGGKGKRNKKTLHVKFAREGRA
jgi:hypothetical protein